MPPRTALVLITSIIATGLFVAASLLFRNKFRFSRMAIVVGGIHLAAVLIVAWTIEAGMLKLGPSEALMGWLWFDIADLPSSLLQLSVIMRLRYFLLREVLFPILFFGVLGSLQYLTLTEMIVRFLARPSRCPAN